MIWIETLTRCIINGNYPKAFDYLLCFITLETKGMCVCWKCCSSGRKEQGEFSCSPPQRYCLTQISAFALNIQLIPSLFLSCQRRYVYGRIWLYYFRSLELQVSSVSTNAQRAFLTLKNSLLFQKAEFLPQRCHCAPFVLRKDVKNLRYKWHMLLAFEKAWIQNG